MIRKISILKKYSILFLLLLGQLCFGTGYMNYYNEYNKIATITNEQLEASNITVVNFINDLRSIDPKSLGTDLNNQKVVFVKNHHSKYDNGGGLFYWFATASSMRNSKSKSFEDNDGTIIHSCGNEKGFWKRENSKSYYNVLWFGARSNQNSNARVDSEENRLAIQKAIYYASQGNSFISKSGAKRGTAKASATIYIPFGKYNLRNFDPGKRISIKDAQCAELTFNNYPTHQFGAEPGKAIAIKNKLNGVTIKGDRATIYGEIDSRGNKITNALYYDDALNQHTIEGLEIIDFNEAISFDTSNTALAIFKVQDCSFYNCNIGITSRQYHFINSKGQDDGSRSTNFIVDGVKMFQVKRIIESSTDLLLIQNCYFNQYKPDFEKGEKHQPLMYLNSGTTILNSIFIPAKGDPNLEGSYWIDFNFAEDTSSRFLNIIGSRFSGENGGISVVKVTAQANDLSSTSMRETNQVFISFVNSKVHSLRGGASNGKNNKGKGGVVTLGTNVNNTATLTPNSISFYNSTNLISGSQSDIATNQLVVSENPDLPLALGRNNDFSFKIYVDEQSMQAYDKNWHFGNANWFPISKELIPYLNRQSRNHMMNRLQVVETTTLESLSILRGNIIEIKESSNSSGSQILRIEDGKPGDVLTITGSNSLSSSVLIENTTNYGGKDPLKSSFILSDGKDYSLNARNSISFVQLESGDWLETNRN